MSTSDVAIVVDSTIFYAQGGGQPSDTGTMSLADASCSTTFEVNAVRKASNGRILHIGQFSPSDGPVFSEGVTVIQKIDGEKRDLHSRIHDAGHILSLAVRRLRASIPDVTELKASHYPDAAFVEFKGLIDGKHKDAIQAKCDEFVDAEFPVKVHWWNEKELREKCAFVPESMSAEEEGGLIRAVDIEGAGAYPCGGTHVESTKLVGKVNVRKISRSKGISKISYSVS